MENPQFILKVNEAVLMPIAPAKLPSVVRKGVWVILGIVLIGSWLFGENLFSELNGTVQILLLALCVASLFAGPKKDYRPSEMEIRFYEDYFVLFRPSRYYSESVSRMELCKMKYADITKCSYKRKSQRIHFYGSGTTTWYNLKKDGSVPNKPTKVNDYTGGLLYFSTRCADYKMIVAAIQENSPLSIVEEND